EREVVILRLQLDRAHASEVSTDAFDVLLDRGALRRVAREARALVGPLVACAPEATAVEVAVRRRDRREVRVAAALPVHVIEIEILGFGDLEREIRELHEAARSEHVEPGMRGVEWDLARPVAGVGPERSRRPGRMRRGHGISLRVGSPESGPDAV